jgi:hypothetical protein
MATSAERMRAARERARRGLRRLTIDVSPLVHLLPQKPQPVTAGPAGRFPAALGQGDPEPNPLAGACHQFYGLFFRRDGAIPLARLEPRRVRESSRIAFRNR